MPFFRLSPGSLEFPSPHLAGPDGLLAVGGDFRPERMVAAYSRGIFPWMVYSGEPVWFSPDPRMVLEPDKLHVGRSLAKIIRRGDFEVRFDTALPVVLDHCAKVRRPGQRGSWISRRYSEGLLDLWGLGLAHSAEAWRDGALVGGLYGLALGRVFFGESMFALTPDASKVAFAVLVRHLDRWGYRLVDCQQETEHLRRFGAEPWPRARFLEALATSVEGDSRAGKWQVDPAPWDGRTDR
ncbi:MAG: leucyl/phenylalanyl-tRNA--protein transferase [Deltaproteobacteria bacterium]|nr:leucyl/phenylalanyl-tRNA--protein transferase [Deltaproteobacteria bacterium]